MKKKSLNKPGMKINGNSFLLMVTVLLFIVSYRGTASCILLCPASSDGKPYDRYPGCRYGIRS